MFVVVLQYSTLNYVPLPFSADVLFLLVHVCVGLLFSFLLSPVLVLSVCGFHEMRNIKLLSWFLQQTPNAGLDS